MRSILETAQRNDVFSLRYGDEKYGDNRIVRVVSKRDTERHPVLSSTKFYNKGVKRTRYLVTCVDVNGQYRNFYAGQEFNAKRVGRVAKIALSAMGQLPKPLTEVYMV